MMRERVYGFAHCAAKRLLRRTGGQSSFRLWHAYSLDDVERLDRLMRSCRTGSLTLNGEERISANGIEVGALYFGENFLDGIESPQEGIYRPRELRSCDDNASAVELWRLGVQTAKVPNGWRNGGLYVGGQTKVSGHACLSSWTWTSAAVARYMNRCGDVSGLTDVADVFVREQLPCGGWVVRIDVVKGRPVALVAPNDSAYLAENAILLAYDRTHEHKYLESAERCASWIMDTAGADGLVHFAQVAASGEWITDRNIVDIGFTVGLFERLYEITGNTRYQDWARRFISRYIAVFWDRESGAFHTAVSGAGHPHGGHFARGQAWALHGLVAHLARASDDELQVIAHRVVARLLAEQRPSGAWAYNLSRPLMGEDCKGTPVLAKTLLDWYALYGDGRAVDAATRALKWCDRHTCRSGACTGGIFAYSIEGGITHSHYSEVSVTYALAYGLEADIMLKEVQDGNALHLR